MSNQNSLIIKQEVLAQREVPVNICQRMTGEIVEKSEWKVIWR